jgi:bifunctional non-homologous end joining protein LigD
MGLDKYRSKRDFSRTPEPKGGEKGGAPGRSYLIQKHAARALHYDLRLELGGVLKSWAVPKGPSLDPGEKRLAVHVEDHPLAYGDFEGIIPEGEYGGGTVLLWDRGEWEPEGDAEKGYRKGHLSFRLHGEKLRGGWTLARMGGQGNADGKNWLLIKKDDEAARPGDDDLFLQENPRSVLSGRSMEEIAAARDLVWHSGEAQQTAIPAIDPADLPGARRAAQPETITPQPAQLVAVVPAGAEWLHEIKFDGYRLICTIRDGAVRLWTRSGQDWTERFSPIARAAASLPVKQAILDGEVVVVDAQGISDFQALQNVLKSGGKERLLYYLFDLIHCNGFDLSHAPLIERKNLLRQILAGTGTETSPLRYSDHIQGEGERVFQHACRFALEGIVSKRADSSYVAKRGGSWVKVKCLQRQEFAIGGFSPPAGSRTGFGALLVGYHDEKKDLVYAGKVGTGFSDRTLRSLEEELRRRLSEQPPFRNPPRGREAAGVNWVRPELVAEVEFSEWTLDGRLRHPSFKGLREDRPAAEIVREEPAPSPGPAKRAAGKGREELITIAGITLSNPERILYPEQGVTKTDLARYYELVGDRILPFVAGRPLTIVRCPQGRQKECFYQKHLNESVPAPVRGIEVREKEGEGLYLIIDDLPGLITLVQLGALEFHPWGSREDKIEQPDQVIFDLDPAPDVHWVEVIRGAVHLREVLVDIGLRSFVKTSGGKGLHVVVPLTRRAEWEEVKEFSRAVAEDVARRHPGRYVTTMSKARRHGKIFIDFFRNSRGATSIAPYSTRARHGAPVSAPLFWEELSADIGPDTFTIHNLPARLARLPQDPWADFFSVRQSITKKIRERYGLK